MTIEPGSWSVEDLLLVGHDALGELGAGDQPGGRAGGDDEVVEGDRARCSPSFSFTSIDLGAGEGAPAVDLLDLVLLHQEVDALDDAVGHLAAARVRRLEVHRGVAGDPELVLLVGQDVRELGVAQQRLRRDAPDVEADTAPVLASRPRPTFRPSWEARMAATYPPGPAPRTTTSKCWLMPQSLFGVPEAPGRRA